MSFLGKSEKTVAEYYEQIRNAQDKIKEIQSQCLHHVFEVHMYMWRPGAMQPQRICTSCNSVVPGVTVEENEKAWQQWHKMIGEKNVP